MRALWISIFVSTSFQVLACTCSDVNKESIVRLKADSDFVVIGTVIQGEHWNDATTQFYNLERQAPYVLFEIDSVIAGNVQTGELVFVFQALSGCSEVFMYGDKHLLFGGQIKKVKKEKYDNTIEVKNTDRPPPPSDIPPPPPPSEFNGNTLILNGFDNGTFKFLRKKLRNYIVIETDDCSSFSSQSESYSEVISLLKP